MQATTYNLPPALSGVGVEGELAAAVLGLGLLESGCVGVGTNDLATVGTDGFRFEAKAGNEIAKSWHDVRWLR